MPRRAYDKVVTLNKRKRGIIRKAIELCNLCDQEIYIVIYDRERDHLVQYKSSDIMLPQNIVQIQTSDTVTHERYDSDDYQSLASKFISKDKME
jgi:hypothetical protein